MAEARRIRLARPDEAPAIEDLQHRALHGLSIGYSAGQMAALISGFGTLDRRLLQEQTYFVCEQDGRLIGCGGWSRRAAEYGTGGRRLDPRFDPARIRAVFVDPAHARTGVARALVTAAEDAARAAGFGGFALVASPVGQRLYERLGYAVEERLVLTPQPGVLLPVVRMRRPAAGAVPRAA